MKAGTRNSWGINERECCTGAKALAFVCSVFLLSACRPAATDSDAPGPEGHGVPVQSYVVINEYPHDPAAFTQGLQYHEGYLYEATGLRGRSSLRRVDLESGRVLRRLALPDRYFGEGIAMVNGYIYMLTWHAETAFVFDLETFQKRQRFSYEGEGWGLAYDGAHLIMSDGTDQLRFRDPETFEVKRTVAVRANGEPVRQINELAWIEGEVWANIFETERLVRIDPSTGEVLAWIDLSGILPPEQRTGGENVLNGIAYDSENKRIFVTGKLWPRLFEIRVVE